MLIEDIARIAHEVNRAYCESVGDSSQLSWYEAPAWQKESVVKGVLLLRGNPKLTPAEIHAAWAVNKINDGWRYGLEKNAEAKTHPCLVQFSQLPERQQSKDYIFSSVVRELLKLT